MEMEEEEQQQSLSFGEKSVSHHRKWLTLEDKLKVINANENGKSSGKIAQDFKMNESSVRLILRKREFYKSLGKSPTFHKLKSFAQQKNSLLAEVERQLFEWLNEQKHAKIHITEEEIQKKALDFFSELKPEYGSGTKFSASRKWLRRFKNRLRVLRCIHSADELPSVEESAQQFRLEIQKIIKEDGLSYHQIFNVDEGLLLWKKLPCSSFDCYSENNEPSKDKLCLLLCSNAAGDFKLKPLVVYGFKAPLALLDCKKKSLPVIWRWNKKSWLTQELFQEWFSVYFCPAVEEYCNKLGLQFKVLLVLDPTICHNIIHPHPEVRIIYLPKNASKRLQPMSLGIFSLFKAQYWRRFSQNIAKSANHQNSWLDFDIKNAIENIGTIWTETDAENLTGAWHQLLPDVKAKDFESQIAEISQEIQNRKLNIITAVENSRNQLALPPNEAHDQCLKFEEVVICEAETEDTFAEENNCYEDFTMVNLKTIIQNIDEACNIIMKNESDVERSIKARQCLQEGIRFYRDIYSKNCLGQY